MCVVTNQVCPRVACSAYTSLKNLAHRCIRCPHQKSDWLLVGTVIRDYYPFWQVCHRIRASSSHIYMLTGILARIPERSSPSSSSVALEHPPTPATLQCAILSTPKCKSVVGVFSDTNERVSFFPRVSAHSPRGHLRRASVVRSRASAHYDLALLILARSPKRPGGAHQP